jgi:hypothetical protein
MREGFLVFVYDEILQAKNKYNAGRAWPALIPAKERASDIIKGAKHHYPTLKK